MARPARRQARTRRSARQAGPDGNLSAGQAARRKAWFTGRPGEAGPQGKPGVHGPAGPRGEAGPPGHCLDRTGDAVAASDLRCLGRSSAMREREAAERQVAALAAEELAAGETAKSGAVRRCPYQSMPAMAAQPNLEFLSEDPRDDHAGGHKNGERSRAPFQEHGSQDSWALDGDQSGIIDAFASPYLRRSLGSR